MDILVQQIIVQLLEILVQGLERHHLIIIERLSLQTVIQRVIHLFRKDLVVLEKFMVRLPREKQRREIKGVDEDIFLSKEWFQVLDVVPDDIMPAKTIAVRDKVRKLRNPRGMKAQSVFHSPDVQNPAFAIYFKVNEGDFHHNEYPDCFNSLIIGAKITLFCKTIIHRTI